MKRNASNYRAVALIWFGGLLVGLLALLAALQGAAPAIDVFVDDEGARRQTLSQFPMAGIAAAKVTHALGEPRYEVGLFGNSRVLHVAAADMQPAQGVFNFGVPGSSFRQSVMLLERLADLGRAPRVAIISLDNFAAEIVSHSQYPGLVTRIRVAIFEASRFATRGEWLNAAHSVDDYLRDEIRASREELFSAKRLAAKLKYLANFGEADTVLAFRTDGSRPPAPGVPPDDPTFNAAFLPGFFLWPGILEFHLGSLAALEDVRVIIYESPISPDAMVPADAMREANEQRRAFLTACARTAIACVAAPSLAGEWADATHAPPDALGRFLAGLVPGRSTDLAVP